MFEYPEDIPPFDMLTLHKTPEIEITHSEKPEICYLANVNRICFGGLKDIDLNAEDVVLLLNHEIWHWAQDLHLSFEEIFECHKAVRDIETENRFVEKTNPYYDSGVDYKIMKGYYVRRKNIH